MSTAKKKAAKKSASKKTATNKTVSKKKTPTAKATAKKAAPKKTAPNKTAARAKKAVATAPPSAAAKLASSLHLPTNAIIGGRSVPAASGATFATINPATGEELAQVARCGAEDVDRAVAAARAAFYGPWSRLTPNERKKVILRFATLHGIDRNRTAFPQLLRRVEPQTSSS